MTKLILTTLLVFVLYSAGFGQNYIYKGDSQFESTATWEFALNGHYWTGNPEFTIAKHPYGGYLMISIEVPFKQDYIGGTVTVFLSDGSTIKCTDKGIRDYVDNRSVALYNFTDSEIERLKYNRITRVRFSILQFKQVKGNFTADNKKETMFFTNSDNSNYHETDVEVLELFGE